MCETREICAGRNRGKLQEPGPKDITIIENDDQDYPFWGFFFRESKIPVQRFSESRESATQTGRKLLHRRQNQDSTQMDCLSHSKPIPEWGEWYQFEAGVESQKMSYVASYHRSNQSCQTDDTLCESISIANGFWRCH